MLRLMASKLRQWRLLKPRTMVTATFKFFVDIRCVAPLVFEINVR